MAGWDARVSLILHDAMTDELFTRLERNERYRRDNLMMPDFHNTRSYVDHYQREQRRKADQFRLALIAQHGQPRLRFYYPLLERLGGWLIERGNRLQARYGELKEVANASVEPTPQTAHLHIR